MVVIIEGINGFEHVKERIEEVDHENLHVKFSVIEGGLATLFKNVKVELEFKEGESSEKCIVKNKIDYEADKDVEIPEEHVQAYHSLLKSVESYLLQHNEP